MDEYEQADELDKCPLEDVKLQFTTVKLSEIMADPSHRLNAKYWITKHAAEDEADVCPSCGGEPDVRNPDEPCHICKYENAERIAEGDR